MEALHSTMTKKSGDVGELMMNSGAPFPPPPVLLADLSNRLTASILLFCSST
jgi:hypothetical protein